MIRGELEAVAAELDDTNDEFPPEDALTLEDAALHLAQNTEALEVVRGARRHLGRNLFSGRGQRRGILRGLRAAARVARSQTRSIRGGQVHVPSVRQEGQLGRRSRLPRRQGRHGVMNVQPPS